MLQTVGAWIVGILFVANIGGLIVISVIRLILAIQCRKIKNGCENMRGINRHFCNKYNNRKEILYLRIEVLKRQIKKNEK